MARIFIIDGHPDPAPERFVHALADAYRRGAEQGQHNVVLVRVADLDVPLLRRKADYQRGEPPESLRRCLGSMEWATHLVIVHPLWLGAMPALLKALLEQVIRPGFAFSTTTLGHWPVKFLRGKSARIIVTTGMSTLSYRWRFGAYKLTHVGSDDSRHERRQAHSNHCYRERRDDEQDTEKCVACEGRSAGSACEVREAVRATGCSELHTLSGQALSRSNQQPPRRRRGRSTGRSSDATG